jgi:hypothetical protein
MKRLILSSALVAIVVSGLLAQSRTTQNLPALFTHVRAAIPEHIELGKEIVFYSPARIDFDLLRKAQPESRLKLNLFPRFEVTGIVETVEKRDAERLTLYGTIEEVPEGTFVLVLEVDAVAGIVDLPTYSSNRVHIRALADGVHLVCQIDPSQAPRCEGAPEGEPPPDNAPPDVRLPDDLPPPGDFTPAACSRPDPIVDLIIYYTARARTQAGGVNAIRAQCQAGVAWTNVAYQRSQIPLRMRLVAAFETAYDESGRTTDEMLNHLTINSDGFIDDAHVNRNTFRADLVALWFHDGGGIAWCCANAGSGFSVSGWSGAGAGWLHAHETGHNLGGAHNVEDIDCGGCHSYSRGHRFIGTDSQRYITIMSYWTGDYATATMIQNFSNPSVTFAGVATGIANQRDNARTIREHSPNVEGFRLTRLNVWVGPATNPQLGTFDFPYATVATGATNIANSGTYDVAFVPFPILHIKSGSYNERPTINKRMRIEACGGTVRIGAP